MRGCRFVFVDVLNVFMIDGEFNQQAGGIKAVRGPTVTVI